MSQDIAPYDICPDVIGDTSDSQTDDELRYCDYCERGEGETILWAWVLEPTGWWLMCYWCDLEQKAALKKEAQKVAKIHNVRTV